MWRSMDFRRKIRDLAAMKPVSGKRDRKTGYAVSLQEDEHRTARYDYDRGRVNLDGYRNISTDELKSLSKHAGSLVCCFSPRSIYADLGDFSSVTSEATLAHIRSTIDKTGLFNEPYAISFRKVYDIDNVRSRFSYLATPLSEINRIGIFDQKEVFLETFCPVEAAVASLVCRKTKNMAVACFEDKHTVRIIGTKNSI
ncbi:hypothetical protein EG829_27670, partial [bacterium]|nr:hypothetical protein [bacterium]